MNAMFARDAIDATEGVGPAAQRRPPRRFASHGEADFADQLLSAMRKQFGGHAEITSAAG
jgi:6-phosphogluconate dehydrogenase (decarboxylating)